MDGAQQDVAATCMLVRRAQESDVSAILKRDDLSVGDPNLRRLAAIDVLLDLLEAQAVERVPEPRSARLLRQQDAEGLSQHIDAVANFCDEQDRVRS